MVKEQQSRHLWGCEMGQKVVGSLGKSASSTAPKIMPSLISPLQPWIPTPWTDAPRLGTLTSAT